MFTAYNGLYRHYAARSGRPALFDKPIQWAGAEHSVSLGDIELCLFKGMSCLLLRYLEDFIACASWKSLVCAAPSRQRSPLFRSNRPMYCFMSILFPSVSW